MAEESTALTVTSADLTKKESLELLDKTYDYLVMLAAVVGVDKANGQPHEVIRINTLLTINVLEWLETAHVEKVVFCSTSETYAGTVSSFNFQVPTAESVPLCIEDITHPRFSYAVTKMLGESGFINFARQGHFECCVVRYHNVYGPNMGFRHVIPHLVERFMAKENPFLIYGHDQTRAFNYIDDAVEGTILAAEKGRNLEVYHIGDEDEITIEALTRFVAERLGFTGELRYAPTFPGSVARRCPDIAKARLELGYTPSVGWKQGVSKTVDWYVNYITKNPLHESFYLQKDPET